MFKKTTATVPAGKDSVKTMKSMLSFFSSAPQANVDSKPSTEKDMASALKADKSIESKLINLDSEVKRAFEPVRITRSRK